MKCTVKIMYAGRSEEADRTRVGGGQRMESQPGPTQFGMEKDGEQRFWQVV